ncbi:MAG: DUF2281 domain-containing protein [Candidatus Symbiothrix sp.]|jgi:hypothetical protein|nr:DUF2281 domain-containing protein [Candidatus Symbiothrix sp.]
MVTKTYQIHKRINRLPMAKRAEVFDFIEFLLGQQQNGALTKQPVFGCAKGRIRLEDDFNAPIVDFNNYMQ